MLDRTGRCRVADAAGRYAHDHVDDAEDAGGCGQADDGPALPYSVQGPEELDHEDRDGDFDEDEDEGIEGVCPVDDLDIQLVSGVDHVWVYVMLSYPECDGGRHIWVAREDGAVLGGRYICEYEQYDVEDLSRRQSRSRVCLCLELLLHMRLS